MHKTVFRILICLLGLSSLVQGSPNHLSPVYAAMQQAQTTQTQQAPPPAAPRSKKAVAASSTTTSQAPVLSNNSHYVNSSGIVVHSPARATSAPAGASAVCGDGSYSFSQHHQGTCSHHGGVSRWL